MARITIDTRRLDATLARKYEGPLRRALAQSYRAGIEAAVNKRSVDAAVVNANGPLVKIFEDMYAEAFATAGIQTWRRLRATVKKAQGKKSIPAALGRLEAADVPPEFRAELERFIRTEAGRKITRIDHTTMERINEATQRAILEGAPLDPDERRPRTMFEPEALRNTIMEILKDDHKYRAHRIARTETHGASQAASLEMARESGVVLVKEWVSADDKRTRDGDNSDFDHTNVLPVLVDQAFTVSGEELMYPGDFSGSAGNVINCRCVMTYITRDI